MALSSSAAALVLLAVEHLQGRLVALAQFGALVQFTRPEQPRVTNSLDFGQRHHCTLGIRLRSWSEGCLGSRRGAHERKATDQHQPQLHIQVPGAPGQRPPPKRGPIVVCVFIVRSA